MIRIIRKLIRYYSNDMRLKHKLLISHLILILAPILMITALFYSQLFNIIVSNTKDTELSLSRETVGNIENTIEDIRNISSEIVKDDTFTEMLSNRSFHKSTENYDELYANLNSFLQAVDAKIDGVTVTDIKIYLSPAYQDYYKDTELISNGILRPISDIQNSYWHGIFSSTGERLLLCPTLYLTSKEKKSSGLISFTRKISGKDNSEAAYVAVYFDKSYLNSMLKEYTTLPGSAKYIINERDAVVSSSSTNLVGKYLVYYNEIPPLVPDTNKFEIKTFSSDKCYISYQVINGADWYMISVIPINSIWSENKSLIMEFLLAYVLVLAFACIVSLLLSNSIVRRISTVINQMKSVKTNEPTPLNTPAEHDEIGDLIETYNYMIGEINNLSEEQVKTASELRTAEFKALQAQINPHFLYNTLDMINWLSKKGLNGDVSIAVQALSKFYKMTLRKGNIVVTIEDELEHVSLYIQLQNMRYDNKIHFTVDIPDNMLEYTIPKIIFQPVVENAIQHGIFCKESKEGNIVITGWTEDDTLVFIISDDGVGIPKEKIDQLMSGKIQSSTGSGVGILNTHNRLQLYYDTQFGLRYRSREGEYTEVEIRIPALKSNPI
ncbi:MAG: sensor histidine kinase [Anaerocolumna sp.]